MAAPNPRHSPASMRTTTAPSPTGSTLYNSPDSTRRTQPPSIPLISPPEDAESYNFSHSNSSSLSGGGSGSAGKNASFASSCNSCGGGTTAVNTGNARGRGKNVLKYKNDKDNKALGKKAQMENDAMVYLEGPQVYTCGQCRTHLTSHDDIMSKAFHGRHGRAYLFDQCVNVRTGPPENRPLITGLHSVSDIFCKRCDHCVGWTYIKAYEPSQKYKEGKFIIEKINLHLEESDYYDIAHPAGERGDKWRLRSMSWGSERSLGSWCSGGGGAVGGGGGGSSGNNGHNGGGASSPNPYGRSGSGRDLGAVVPSSPRMSSRNHVAGSNGNIPRTPPPAYRRERIRAGSGSIPQSPRSPGEIVYEYRNDE
mmetsp:Transcript_2988/g.6465  ORF Transcript_2988/g.6465 Transcript_2988/m.6465 type:complete len:366 (+) Transcript_2988:164-1261(+)